MANPLIQYLFGILIVWQTFSQIYRSLVQWCIFMIWPHQEYYSMYLSLSLWNGATNSEEKVTQLFLKIISTIWQDIRIVQSLDSYYQQVMLHQVHVRRH